MTDPRHTSQRMFECCVWLGDIVGSDANELSSVVADAVEKVDIICLRGHAVAINLDLLPLSHGLVHLQKRSAPGWGRGQPGAAGSANSCSSVDIVSCSRRALSSLADRSTIVIERLD